MFHFSEVLRANYSEIEDILATKKPSISIQEGNRLADTTSYVRKKFLSPSPRDCPSNFHSSITTLWLRKNRELSIRWNCRSSFQLSGEIWTQEWWRVFRHNHSEPRFIYFQLCQSIGSNRIRRQGRRAVFDSKPCSFTKTTRQQPTRTPLLLQAQEPPLLSPRIPLTRPWLPLKSPNWLVNPPPSTASD